MLKKIFIFFIVIISLFLCLVIWVNINISGLKKSYIFEVERYLKEKYSEDMVVTENVIIGDEKSVQVYLRENAQITFFVRKGNYFVDTYIAECLRYDTKELLNEAFVGYDAEIYVSELKWCNPIAGGEFETYYYLDKLYSTLGRIPTWKDINEYQRIESVEVLIKGKINAEDDVLKSVEKLKSLGCHIENLQIKDEVGRIYNYSL